MIRVEPEERQFLSRCIQVNHTCTYYASLSITIKVKPRPGQQGLASSVGIIPKANYLHLSCYGSIENYHTGETVAKTALPYQFVIFLRRTIEIYPAMGYVRFFLKASLAVTCGVAM